MGKMGVVFLNPNFSPPRRPPEKPPIGGLLRVYFRGSHRFLQLGRRTIPKDRRRDRRGLGVLPVLVLVLLVVLALVGTAQRMFGSQVSGQTYRLAMGRLAQRLAESAVEEAMHQVRSRVNDPASPIFAAIRKEVYTGETGALPLPVKLTHAERFLSEPPFKAFFLEDVTADVVYQGQFSQLPYERYGLVRCRARAGMRLGLTEKVVRTVETGFDVKVALGSTPRPFDQATVYIQDGASLGVARAERRREEALRTLDAMRLERGESRRAAEARRAEIRPGGADTDALLAEYAALDVPAMGGMLHPFDDDHLVLFRVQDRVDLRELDLPGAVHRFEQDLDLVDRRLEAARSGLATRFADAGAHREYLTAFRDMVSKRTRFLQWLLNFQNATSEYSGEAGARLSDFDYKLEPLEWRRKAFHVIREGPAGPVGSQLAALKARLGRLDGVVLVDNPVESLELEGELAALPGMLVLVTTGRVRLAGAGASGGPADLLTVVAYGPMTVEGDVRASLLPRDRLNIAPGTQVRGTLVLRELADPSRFPGVIVRDPRVHSGLTSQDSPEGAFPDYYVAAIAPRPTYREVTR